MRERFRPSAALLALTTLLCLPSAAPGETDAATATPAAPPVAAPAAGPETPVTPEATPVPEPPLASPAPSPQPELPLASPAPPAPEPELELELELEPPLATSAPPAGEPEPVPVEQSAAPAPLAPLAPPAPASDLDIDTLLEAAEIRWDDPPEGAEPVPAWRRSAEELLERAQLPLWSAWLTAGVAQLTEPLPPPAREGVRDLFAGRFTTGAKQALGAIVGALVGLLVLARMLRGRGELAIAIEYPSELRGSFTVRLRRAKTPAKQARVASPEAAERARRQARASSKTAHTSVSRETHFREVPAGRYWVSVDGYLQTIPGSDGTDPVVTPHFEEREVYIRRGRSLQLEFDLHPAHCPVDVKVLWDRKPVGEALVALRGVPTSVRYARGGPARLGVGRGRHVIVVGSADRVAEHPIEVTSFQPASLVIDLTDRELLLFTGCPPAVEPYLQGDTSAAARALETDGQDGVAHLLRARFHESHGEPDVAAHHYEEAGLLTEAARLREELRDYQRSAELYDRAGEAMRAAELYQSAGQLVRAGEAYERARQYESAVECFREAEDVPRWIESLEKYGSPYQAASVAMQHEDWASAIRCLERVPANDPCYPEAVTKLVDAYENVGHLDLAARKVEELVARRGEEHTPLESCDRLAELLEKSGDYDRALEVLELIRRRDATWPGVATRIEELRKRRSRESLSDADTNPIPGTEGFSDGFRYEILEEIGRGGMGIVFKARDRRLGRSVALKRLPENLRNHPKAIELFLREARAAAALNHPNIVTLFDAGNEGDAYYITMELLEGAPLQKILRKRVKFTTRDAARLGVQVANGLAYAHEQKIIHRDIKTANLFFTKGKTVKIMDFGLAKMVEEVRRSTTVIGGTPYYMAPEQTQGGNVDHRADLYALGVTLYEFVTGTVPFEDGDVTFHHRHTPPPDPRERSPEIPDAMAALLRDLLAKDPNDRCESAAEVSRRLQEISKALG